MKTRVRRTMAMLVAVCMILFTGADVFAVSVGSLTEGTITVHTGGRDVAGEEFAVYKLMDCHKDGDKKVYKVSEPFAEFFKIEGEGKEETKDENGFDKKVLKYLEKESAKRVFQGSLRNYIGSNDVKALEVLKGETIDKEYVTSPLRFGVYAIVPENSEQGVMIVKLNKSEANAYLTGREPAVSKHVNGKSWICAQIGELMNFEVTSSVPYMDEAENYTFRIEDTFSEALNLSKETMNIEAKLGDEVLEEGRDYLVNVDGRRLSVDFVDFAQYKELVGEHIKVTYETVLNEKANVKDVISNKANVYYGAAGSEEMSGEPASVNIRTNELEIFAADEPGVGLEGNTFEIYKGKDVYGEALKVVALGDGKYKVSDGKSDAENTEMISPEDGKIKVEGLSDGDYTVAQVKTKENYKPKTKTSMVHIDVMSTDNGFETTVTGNEVTMTSNAIKISGKGKIMIGAVAVAVLIGLGYFVYSSRKK